MYNSVFNELEEYHISGFGETAHHYCDECPHYYDCQMGDYVYDPEEASDEEFERYHEKAYLAYESAWEDYVDDDYDNREQKRWLIF